MCQKGFQKVSFFSQDTKKNCFKNRSNNGIPKIAHALFKTYRKNSCDSMAVGGAALDHIIKPKGDYSKDFLRNWSGILQRKGAAFLFSCFGFLAAFQPHVPLPWQVLIPSTSLPDFSISWKETTAELALNPAWLSEWVCRISHKHYTTTNLGLLLGSHIHIWQNFNGIFMLTLKVPQVYLQFHKCSAE